jgi:hypothetical protein
MFSFSDVKGALRMGTDPVSEKTELCLEYQKTHGIQKPMLSVIIFLNELITTIHGSME